MTFTFVDYLLIILFFLVIAYIIFKELKTKPSHSDFFNAGGRLTWLMIGASILGTNVAFAYIMNCSSNGFAVGLAYGSYEWTASLIILMVALYIAPQFLRIGILTLPEYLEYRFNKISRIFMAVIFLMSQLGIIIIMMYYNGAFMKYLWGIPNIITISFIAFIGGAIIYSGGMLSKIRLDMMVIFLFFVSGFILLILCLLKVEGISRFIHLAGGRLEVALPANHSKLPWTSVFIGGLWLMHIQYWAFYQPIAQTVVASATLSEAQKGLLFAATAKIVTPFLMIMPGIIGYELYASQITSVDDVLPFVIKKVAPTGLGGIILIGYISTMFTTFTGHLNATVVVFTKDIFPYLAPVKLRSMDTIQIARISTLVIAILSIVISYYLVPEGGFFKFTELTLLMVAPVSTTVFLFAIFSRRTSSLAAIVTMVAGIPLFFILKSFIEMSLLNISGITFLVLCGLMGIMRIIAPLSVPVIMPEKFAIKFERNLIVEIWGIFIIVAILAIYALLL